MIFVFSLEDEISFQTVYHYYSRMANYRNTAEVPLVLVGTQGESWREKNLCDISYDSNLHSIQGHILQWLGNNLNRIQFDD